MKKIKLLMVDNYDSFTYNIVQYFGELGADIEVFRNDEISLAGIAQRNPDRLVISPGPCSPAEAGISVAAIQHFAGKLPILGVCLAARSFAHKSSCTVKPVSFKPIKWAYSKTCQTNSQSIAITLWPSSEALVLLTCK
jgi:anthranilate synthase/aminodeoxychorismate synthase-like glutamine amidotransferase